MPILNPGRGITSSLTRARDTQTDGKLAAVRANPANSTVGSRPAAAIAKTLLGRRAETATQ